MKRNTYKILLTVALVALMLVPLVVMSVMAGNTVTYTTNVTFEDAPIGANASSLNGNYGLGTAGVPTLASISQDPTNSANKVFKMPLNPDGSTGAEKYNDVINGGKNIDRNLSAALTPMSSGKAVFEVSYYIEEGSVGIFESQGYHVNYAGKDVAFDHWHHVNTSTGLLYIYGHEADQSAKLKFNTWNTVSIVLDFATGLREYYVNGIYAFTSSEVKQDYQITSNTQWVFAKINKNFYDTAHPAVQGDESTYPKGTVYIDNVRVHALTDGELTTSSNTDTEGEQALYTAYKTVMGTEVKVLPGVNVLKTPDTWLDEQIVSLNSISGDVLRPLDKVQMRLTNMGGIRFATQVNETALNRLLQLKDDGVLYDLEIGTMIAPSDYVDTAGAFTVDAFDEQDLPYLLVKAKVGAWYHSSDFTLADGYNKVFVGSIIGIKEGNRERDFAAVGYVKLTTMSGDEYYIYSYDAANADATYSRSLKTIAETLKGTEWFQTASAEVQDLINIVAKGSATMDIGSKKTVSNVKYTDYELFFQTSTSSSSFLNTTISHRISFDGADGWRYQAAKAIDGVDAYNVFSNNGAAQSLAAYMGEPYDFLSEKITVTHDSANSTLKISATDQDPYVIIHYGNLSYYGNTFGIEFYSPDGKLMSNISSITADGSEVVMKGGLIANEAVYGGGQRFDTNNKRGTSMNLYIWDGWNVEYGGQPSSYVAIPLFTTSRGAGMFINRYEPMEVSFGSASKKTQADTWTVTLENDLMDCYFYATGKMTDALLGYTELTGSASLPEEWAQGIMICRYGPDLASLNGSNIVRDITQCTGYNSNLYIDKELSTLATAENACTVGNYLYGKDSSDNSYCVYKIMQDDEGIYYHTTFDHGGLSGRGVKEIVEGLIDAGMTPTAVIMEAAGGTNVADAYNRARVKAMIDWLHQRGIKAMIYTGLSAISPEMAGFDYSYYMYANVTKDGVTERTYNLPKPDTNNPDSIGSAVQSYLDITNPVAVDWYMNTLWADLIDLGVDGVKVDFCENVPNEGAFSNGVSIEYDLYDDSIFEPDTIHHAYPSYAVSLFYREMNRLMDEKKIGNDFVLLTRGGGIGSQRNPYMWAGDQTRTFANLTTQLTSMLTSGISGIPFMTVDMAGYQFEGGGQSGMTVSSREQSGLAGVVLDEAGVKAYESEIFMRAIQYMAFTSNIQTHGSVRNMFELTQQAQDVSALYTNLHYDLIDYIQKQSQIACDTGMPVVRHLVLQYQNDANVYDINDQYMLGDALLIAPVLTWSGTDFTAQKDSVTNTSTRSIYLPAGNWVDLLTGETLELTTGKWIEKTVAISQIPVFLNLDSEDADNLSQVFNGTDWQYINGGKPILGGYDPAEDDIFFTPVGYDPAEDDIFFTPPVIDPEQMELDLKGLNVLAFGDSLFDAAVTTSQSDQWLNKMGTECGWNLTNLGIGGMTVSKPTKNEYNKDSMYSWMFEQKDEKQFWWGSENSRFFTTGTPSGNPEDLQLIILEGGNNDFGPDVAAPLGEWGVKDYTTFMGAWQLIVDQLLVEYPNATIVFLTPWEHGESERTNYTRSIITMYNAYRNHPTYGDRFRLIDAGKPSVSGVDMTNDAWRNQYSHDSFHLNEQGMDIVKENLRPLIWQVVDSWESEKK